MTQDVTAEDQPRNWRHMKTTTQCFLMQQFPPMIPAAIETEESQTRLSKRTVQLLEQTAGAIDIDVSDSVKKWFKSARASLPLNEFSHPDFCLSGAFPHIFLYGQAYRKEVTGNPREHTSSPKGHLTTAEHRHLLQQFTAVPATCRELIFYLFDQKQRQATIKSMFTKVHANPDAFQKLGNIMASKDFPNKIKEAIERPKTKEAEDVISQILPVLSTAGRNTTFGAFEQSTSIAESIALTQRHGPASVFLTVAPNDVNNPTAFRLTFRGINNEDFPATAPETFIQAMKKESIFLGSGDVRIPTNHSEKSKRVCDNPVAVVLEYERLVQNILHILIGIQQEQTVKKTTNCRKSTMEGNHKGVFGHVLAMNGVHETQQRGTLHFHVVLWGSLNPRLLEGAAQYEDICDVIGKVLDKMYTAELPRQLHVKHLIKEEMSKRFAPSIEQSRIGPAIIPSSLFHLQPHQESWDLCSHLHCLQTNIHHHTFTCYKGTAGHQGCRLARPFGTCSFTSPSILSDHHDQTLQPSDPSVSFIYKFNNKQHLGQRSNHIQPKRSSTTRDISTHPIPSPDDRVLVWELKRPQLEPLLPLPQTLNPSSDAAKQFCIDEITNELSNEGTNDPLLVSQVSAWMDEKLEPDQVVGIYNHISSHLPAQNGLVIEFNDTLINATGSAVNCIVLGNTAQSKSALFYLAPYLGKCKVKLATCLTTLNEAHKHTQKHTSIAEDSGTDQRTSQHILSRTLNSLNKQMEVSDTQAVLGLLGVGSQIRSHHFHYYGAQDAVQFVTKEAYKSSLHIASDQDLLCDPTSDCSDNDEIQHPCVSDPSDNSDFSSQSDIAAFLSQTDIDPSSIGDYTAKARLCNVPSHDSDKPTKVPVCYQTDYRFRGKELSMLSRHEYYALISIKEKGKKKKTTPRTDGRKPNATFEFDKGHPLHNSHVQYLRSKQPVIIFNGKQPPHPGPPPQPDDSNPSSEPQS